MINIKEGTLKYLLSVGANSFIRDSYGETPYNYALSNGHFEIAEILINIGSHINHYMIIN